MIRLITTKPHTLPFEAATVGDVIYYMQITDCYGVDTETTGEWNGKNQTLLLQVGDKNVQYVVDWQSISRAEKDAILTEMSNPATTKILQNAKFDLKFFFQEGHYLRNIYDVMVAEAVIHAGKDMPEGSYRLDTMAKKYAGMELDKSIRGVIHREGLTERVVKYAAQDVECLPAIMQQQHATLQQLGMASNDTQDELTVLGIDNRACLCLGLMEYNGVKRHAGKWDALTAEFAAEIVRLEHELDSIVFTDILFEGIGKRQLDMFGGNATGINWASPQQKLEILQRINPSIQDTSERSVSKHRKEHSLIPLMQRYIRMAKLYNGFALSIPQEENKVTGRIHTSFWQNLKSGRISASKPNLLQIPSRTDEGKQMRACFIPEEGYKIVGGDYAQCELRLIAELSQDPLWIETFREGRDLHSELCARTFDIPIADIKKVSPFREGVSYRDIQKQVNFMLSYGGGAFKLSDMLQITEQQAQQIIDKFFAVVPKVKEFLDRAGKYAVNAKKSISLAPYRRIRWMEWKNSWEIGEVERSGKNHPMQAGNADILKCALGRIYYYLVENNLQHAIKPILPVHDEIQTECKEELAEQWKDKLQQIMIESGEIIIKSIPVVVDCKIADCWEK